MEELQPAELLSLLKHSASTRLVASASSLEFQESARQAEFATSLIAACLQQQVCYLLQEVLAVTAGRWTMHSCESL
jgi:hypothetical protein